MARKPQAQGGGEAEFFAAIEALTWREMRSIADLIALQLDGSASVPPDVVATALADAAESFAEAGED